MGALVSGGGGADGGDLAIGDHDDGVGHGITGHGVEGAGLDGDLRDCAGEERRCAEEKAGDARAELHGR